MWTKDNYRRIFLDMHLADWNDAFLSRLDPKHNVEIIKAAGAQNIVVKAKPHTGLCYWPASIGRMHRGLKGRDYVGEMIDLCHENQISVIVYYSEVFDNWAYENHPSWRTVYADGLNSKEKGHFFFRKGRYGVLCVNNPAYRAYVMDNLRELCTRYSFEGMFLDMPFWPEVCYCDSCKEKYRQATGREMPKIVDWEDPAWLEFQFLRENWMKEFLEESVATVKGVNPDITIEFNSATAMFNWQFGASEYAMRASDYVGGDYYGSILQESFACKYYKNVSRTLPFCYITSRCDPDLIQHTTTKTAEEFLQHGVIALAHNGAFSICDGMNPDGTICDQAYAGPIREAFAQSRVYEPYVTGALQSSVQIWFATHAKFSMVNQGKHVLEQPMDNDTFVEGKLKLAGILRENHIPFDVIGNNSLSNLDLRQPLVISEVHHIRDEEMEAIEAFLQAGGTVYLSGAVGHPRLYQLLEAEDHGLTAHTVTYMEPTEAGRDIFAGFDAHNPMTVNMPQRRLSFRGAHQVLATLTLPYTLQDDGQFSAIHSDPPGEHTDWPSLVRKAVGKGQVIWAAAGIEKLRPQMSRNVVCRLIRSLCQELPYEAEAPSYVEVVSWKKDGKVYLAALNEQETTPIDMVHGVSIRLPYPVRAAALVGDDRPVTVEAGADGARLLLPPFRVAAVVEVEPQA